MSAGPRYANDSNYDSDDEDNYDDLSCASDSSDDSEGSESDNEDDSVTRKLASMSLDHAPTFEDCECLDPDQQQYDLWERYADDEEWKALYNSISWRQKQDKPEKRKRGPGSPTESEEEYDEKSDDDDTDNPDHKYW
ncbi:hypothetical protein BT63DRAFT_414645 [Microthyrium microscopicum]|uniref:Uncharacterized protein n=1 Tax=Microthyrium microscopicum TaxID=703497 RepID=A0A6A6U9P0_9PEZI|nr:hypothetical protein BT63DRAFT_414645 [Microthyrium microscopicum]